MITEAFSRFHSLPASVRASISAGLTIVIFLTGAILEGRLQKVTGDQPGDVAWGLLWILTLLIVAFAWGRIHLSYSRFIDSLKKNLQERESVIADARERVTRLNVEHLARCDAIMEKQDLSVDELRSALICELDRIDKLIKAAWEIVNSKHNVSMAATDRLNFEMTLITPSLRDSELTIASWCNRENVRPKSLLLREQGEAEIYRRTEAAKMIQKGVTDTEVIEDTSAPTEDYQPLYEGQKVRIRSSVLHPILSSKSEHLGVLVLHCEQTGFFRKSDRRYWRELFLVFAPAIALELERIKAFNKAVSTWPSPPLDMYRPY